MKRLARWLLRRRRAAPVALTAVLLVVLVGLALAAAQLGLLQARAGGGPRSAQGTALALIGDVPYGTGEEIKFARVVEAINASHRSGGVRLVVHTGDVKRGAERCDDSLLQRRFELFQRLEPAFIITPGDNDWADCHRVASGRYLPTERLARLRQIFYPKPGMTSGRHPMPVLTQAQASTPAHRAYVENQLWAFAGITMATVHVVGSGNGLEPWDEFDRRDRVGRPRADRMAEFAAREAATLAWIDSAFEHAREHGSAGVMIAMQADPQFHRRADDPARQGFNRVLERLAQHTRAFGKPVLLAHGDSHMFRFDKPLQPPAAGAGLPTLDNFSRVENFGSPHVHWVEIRIDAAAPAVFHVVPHYLLANLLPF